MAERIKILDTTLRDGEQSPGGALTPPEKLELARVLAVLGVDVLEVGFPAASRGEAEAVRRIAQEIGQGSEGCTPIICALARGTVGDIDRAWEAIRGARFPRIHLSLPTSDIHLQHKLQIDRPTLLKRVREMVSHARHLCEDVEFGAEDASRTEFEFLNQVFDEAIRAGARTLDIPDTVGHSTPEDYGALVRKILLHTPGIEKTTVSVHCHDDLGLATANTLAGVRAGARQVEVTINGIGERAGNASLEEVAVALSTRYGFTTGIDLEGLVPVSRLVSRYTGIAVQPNKAIVGANAFAHESGIHQDGLLKHPDTYEIMSPQSVGAPSRRLVLGKHSGRNALFSRLKDLGIDLPEAQRDKVFERFKALADGCKEVMDEDLRGLLKAVEADSKADMATGFEIESLQLTGEVLGAWKATVILRGDTATFSAVGKTGPEAICAALVNATNQAATLRDWSLQAVAGNIRCEMVLDRDGTGSQRGSAENPDPMMALAKACAAALRPR